jgi:Domain of unknown function (DUF3597)
MPQRNLAKRKAASANLNVSFRRHSASAKLEPVPSFALASAAWAFKFTRRLSSQDAIPADAAGKNVVKTLHSIFWVQWEQAMSIFGKIMSAIFGSTASATPAGGAASGGGAAAGAGSAAAPAQTVDVAPILDKAVAAKKEKLAWRTSIVDLMKALDIDSSLGARKELAKELGYTGDTNDSATMNIWLHKQVMAKLAANGGKLPADVKW